MEDRKMHPGEKWTDYIDAEDRPRNAAAITAALMTGAEFIEIPSPAAGYTSQWQIKGIDCVSHSKTMPAWLWLGIHGIGITNDARAVLLKDIEKENVK